MSDEEKNAIEITKRFTKEMITRHYLSDSMIDIRNSIETTLNLIEKQQKIIDLMIKDIISMSTYIDSMGIYTEFAKATEEYVYNSYEKMQMMEI